MKKELRGKFYTPSPEVGINNYNHTNPVSFNMQWVKDEYGNIETKEVIANDTFIRFVAKKSHTQHCSS